MRKFTKTPTTVEFEEADGNKVVLLGERVEYGRDPGGEAPFVVQVTIRGEVRYVPLASIEDDLPTYMRGTRWPSGGDVHVREPMPSDAITSENINGRIPLPVEVIGTMVSEPTNDWTGQMDVALHAVTNDEGYVSTLLLIADTGTMYARYDNAWVQINDPDLLDGMNIVDVADTALAQYDAHDESGQQVHVGALTLADSEDASRLPEVPRPEVISGGDPTSAPDVTTPDLVDETPPEQDATGAAPPMAPPPAPLTAGAGRVKVRTIEDVPSAITAAAADPSIRWIVEKRARALGYEGDMPW